MQNANDPDLTKEINGKEFRTIKFNPEDAYDLLAYLGSLMGGPLGSALGAFAQGDDTADKTIAQLLGGVDGEDFGAALEKLFLGLNHERPSKVMKQILQRTDRKIEGQDGWTYESVDLNRDFDGDLFDVFPLLTWVLKANYENFFSKLRKFGKDHGSDLASKVKSQISSNDTTSSGGSGGQSSTKRRRFKKS